MKLRLFFLFFLLSAIASFVMLTGPGSFRAQSTKGKAVPCCGKKQAVGPRELDFPYYSLGDGFNSTLYLVSDSPKSTQLTIAVRNLAGQAVLSTANIDSQQRLTIDLRALLLQQGADPSGSFAEGSVAVYFTGTIMPVVGQITMTNPVTHLVHESEMLENDPGRTDIPAVLNGLWWGLSGGRDARIMVSNTRGQGVVADMFLEFLGQSHQVRPDGIAFMPHETKVLSVTDLLGELGFSPAQVPQGGITIMARGGVGGLMAQGKILDPVTGFSTTLRFPSPDSQLSNALHAVGIPIGKPTKDSPFAGMGMFTPRVALRNMTGTVQTATLTVEYPEGAMAEKAKKVKVNGKETDRLWEFDGEAGQSTGQLVLPPVSIPAYSTEEVSLLSALGQLPLPVPYASLRIQYTGATGGVMAEVASVDESNDLAVDSHVVNEGWGWAGSGANPWHLDDQTESILFLTDMGDKPARIGFFVTAGDVKQLLTELRLDPHETRAIDLRKLRDTQRQDYTGHRIPADASDGTVTWVRADNVPVAGRVVVINRRTGTASNYDCCTCQCSLEWDGYDAFFATNVCDNQSDACPQPISVDAPVNGGVQIYAFALYEDCNGIYGYQIDVTSYAGWSTSNSSVATVSDGYVSGVAVGSAQISATYEDCGDYENYLGGGCACNYYNEFEGYANITVGDGTPTITSVSPSAWPGGATTTVTLGGTSFGTNTPGLSVTGIIKDGNPSIISHSNTQIVFDVTVDPSDPGNTASIVVTSNGYDGNGFVRFADNPGEPDYSPSAAATAAVPTNVKLVSAVDLGNGSTVGLKVNFTYQSSTNDIRDLATCQGREYVTFPNDSNDHNAPCPNPYSSQTCYYPPSPPWPSWSDSGMGAKFPNPTTPPTQQLGSGKASDTDSITDLNFVQPFSGSSFIAGQELQYSCNNGANWTDFYGPATITYSMSKNSQGKWAVTISRSDTSQTSTYVIPGQ